MKLEMDHTLFWGAWVVVFFFFERDGLMGSIQANNRAESVCSPLPVQD